ncbi:lipid A biosynthesis lauroyl acyltransferase [Corynebacterium atypicum]|uniref:Lipid A biosynthesis lauroyl acyltransferase n=1 Tax=Corynebacterium atypicum TaxID=191610 RepID=A0ABM5QMP7_9CORY|nr:phosphatidylinositol mannoside acyltransferase [Corynebacterium atypicum]AIG64042.1 lipid A biosynthesis lauroyl acyltransferase [Corynebacterium atypicum]
MNKPFFAPDFAALGYLLGWRVVRFLPHRLVLALAEKAADWASNNGAGMNQLCKNLMRVVGPENVTRRLVRDSVRSYARYWAEAFRLPSLAGDPELLDRLQSGIVGEERFQRSFSSGRGVILVLPHTGNWDMAGMYVTGRYTTFTTVAERVRPEVLFDAFVDYRRQLGFEVLAHAGGPAPMGRLREVLEDGGVVCLVGERDLKGHGAKVEFFGEETTMPTGSVDLARETGAALHVVHCWFAGSQWGFSVGEEVAHTTQAQMMQEVADQFARNIAAHPEDWHMLQPLWPKDRKRRRKARSGREV